MDWNIIIPPVIEAIITGLITGLFTVIGVIITNRFNAKRMDRKDKEQQNIDKPFFSVKEEMVSNEYDLDINAIVTTFKTIVDENEFLSFEYDEKLREKEKRCYIDFEFENEGKNMAMDFYIAVCEQKHNAIFAVKDLNSWIKSHYINFAIYNKQSIIKKGDKIKIRMNYLKEMESQVYNLLLLYMDAYGNIWEQLFNPFDCSLERPHMISYKKLRDTVHPQSFIENYGKPWE